MVEVAVEFFVMFWVGVERVDCSVVVFFIGFIGICFVKVFWVLGSRGSEISAFFREVVLVETRFGGEDVGIFGVVLVLGFSVSVVKVVRVWVIVGTSFMGAFWGRDICLDRIVIFFVVFFRGAIDIVEVVFLVMVIILEVGNVVFRSWFGVVFVV